MYVSDFIYLLILLPSLITCRSTDYAGWVGKFAGQSFPANDGFYKVVRHEPLGVVAGYETINPKLNTRFFHNVPSPIH